MTDPQKNRVIVNMQRGERDFPIGKYAKVSNARGDVGHSIKRLRLMPGLNLLDKAVINGARGVLATEQFTELAAHPDFKRLTENGSLRVYDSRSSIPVRDRVAIAEMTVDMDVLEAWTAVEDNAEVKVALRQQAKLLTERGQAQDDRNVAATPERQGQAATF